MDQDKRAGSLPLYASGAHTTTKPRRKYLRIALSALVTAFGLAYLSQTVSYSIQGGERWSTCTSLDCTRNPAYLVKAKHGAVASENELCSQVGVRTLKKGGNAVDAAVSTTLCTGVVNMFSYVIRSNSAPSSLAQAVPTDRESEVVVS